MAACNDNNITAAKATCETYYMDCQSAFCGWTGHLSAMEASDIRQSYAM